MSRAVPIVLGFVIAACVAAIGYLVAAPKGAPPKPMPVFRPLGFIAAEADTRPGGEPVVNLTLHFFKDRPFDTSNCAGDFMVRYMFTRQHRPTPVAAGRAVPLFNDKGRAVTGCNRRVAKVGAEALFNGRWAPFPVRYCHATHLRIEVPGEYANGREGIEYLGPIQIDGAQCPEPKEAE